MYVLYATFGCHCTAVTESKCPLVLDGKFVLFGSAFEADADSKAKAFVPVWKQQAVDDQGRRRFHGAFTGGFSAGYFNTVGSKEGTTNRVTHIGSTQYMLRQLTPPMIRTHTTGFTPATFQTSRSNRAELRQQRPEDLMDDEDHDVCAAL
jgi:G patch domain-containing protein 1